MQTFTDFEYHRPDVQKEKATATAIINQFSNAKSFDEQTIAIKKFNTFRNRMSTLRDIAFIRASIDTNNQFYKKERDFWDEFSPELSSLNTRFYEVLIRSPFRKELEAKWGKQLFALGECEMKSFSPEVIPLLQKENKLSSEYAQLIASAQVEFQGKTYTLAQLSPFTQNKDRSIRKQAIHANTSFFEQHAEQFDSIYDQLVKVRHEIATKLGYKNFVELGYLRMSRIDYDASMLANFRQQIRESIVPLVQKLYKKQAERIGVDSLKYYDENYKFPSGNPTPKGSPEWIVKNGKTMYEQLSTETNEFINYMLDRKLMDLEAKKGKEAGGYCTFLNDYEAPFIFSNFNGTSDDIDVLTHEAGHAFQFYSSRHLDMPEYLIPTYEAAEIHSMSMEFFTWPWMELFFKEDSEKYKFTHLSSALQFLPYGVAVDEFQHLVYENPEWTPKQRKAAWKKLEEVYLPHRDYDGISYLETGGFWQRQGHIYEVPFYYIDYTLAQICAFQFWQKSLKNHEEAWKDYIHLCQLGGSKSFLELVAEANLKSPFTEGTVKSVVGTIETWLNKVDQESDFSK